MINLSISQLFWFIIISYITIQLPFLSCFS